MDFLLPIGYCFLNGSQSSFENPTYIQYSAFLLNYTTVWEPFFYRPVTYFLKKSATLFLC